MKSLLTSEDGATAIEYGLIASVIAVALVSAFLGLGSGVSDQFGTVEQEYAGVQN